MQITYILESNLHPFYSFRGLNIQMRIRIECGLDLRIYGIFNIPYTLEVTSVSGFRWLLWPYHSLGSKSLVSHYGSPGQVMFNLWWTKRHWGRFSPNTSVFPACHPTDSSTLIITIIREAGTVGQMVVDMPSRLSLTQPQDKKLSDCRTKRFFLSSG
jgi:hypothetical protein